ncbi:hypothetical protein D3C79_702610 [compost metagenome]
MRHGGIVIPWRNAGDIIAPIFRTQRSVAVENHAGSDGLLTHGVADVKAFHAVNLGKIQDLRQFCQPLMNRRLLRKLGCQRGRGVGTRKFKVTSTIATRFALDLNLATSQLGERLRQQVFFGQIEV